MIKKIIHPITPIIIFLLSQAVSWSLKLSVVSFVQNRLLLILNIIGLGIFAFVLPIIGIVISILLIARKEKVIISIIGLILNLAPLLFSLFVLILLFAGGLPA